MNQSEDILCTCGHTIGAHVLGVCGMQACPCVGETCQGCSIDRPAVCRVTIDEIDMMVCELCATAAKKLGL